MPKPMSTTPKPPKFPKPEKPGKPMHGIKPRNNHKDDIIYEFNVYAYSSTYGGDFELIATLYETFRDVFSWDGKEIAKSNKAAEEFVRNIGLFGITVEDPEDVFTYYPPSRISKVEYKIVSS